MNNKSFYRNVESIEIALSILKFTYRLEGYLGHKGIQQLFRPDIEVKGVMIEGKEITLQQAADFLHNHFHSALCSFWIAIDEAFDEVFGSKKPEGVSLLDDFRTVIYMFRCAFSHKISQPLWMVIPQYQRRPYHLLVPFEHRVGGVEEFYFDFSILNRQLVQNKEYKYLNGLLTLYNIACQLLKE